MPNSSTNNPGTPNAGTKHAASAGPPGGVGQAAVKAYIALGSNLGDRQGNIRQAVELLGQSPGVSVLRVSSLLENPAVGGPEGSPDFINAAVEIRTTLGPHALLGVLLDVEQSLGRDREVKWEPRTIDLDLLLFGDQIVSSDELIVPHPMMHERRFVLVPLAELVPDLVHPTLQMTVGGLLESVGQGSTEADRE